MGVLGGIDLLLVVFEFLFVDHKQGEAFDGH